MTFTPTFFYYTQDYSLHSSINEALMELHDLYEACLVEPAHYKFPANCPPEEVRENYLEKVRQEIDRWKAYQKQYQYAINSYKSWSKSFSRLKEIDVCSHFLCCNSQNGFKYTYFFVRNVLFC